MPVFSKVCFMLTLPRAAVAAVLVVAAAASAQAQGKPEYRGFALGATLESVAAITKTPMVETRTLHTRPSLIQVLDWRPVAVMGTSVLIQRDPVRQVTFTFFDNQLYRMVIDYDRDRTEGLTGADIVKVLEASYGSPMLLSDGIAPSTIIEFEASGGRPIARWGDADYAVVLYQTPGFSGRTDNSHFVLIVTSPKLSSLSRSAIAQALVLDHSEAPARESARRQKDADDDRAAAEKARRINQPAFTP